MALTDLSLHLLYHVDHFRVEIANPVHLILTIAGVHFLQYVLGIEDHRPVKTFTLMFRNNSEKDAKGLVICPSESVPKEL